MTPDRMLGMVPFPAGPVPGGPLPRAANVLPSLHSPKLKRSWQEVLSSAGGSLWVGPSPLWASVSSALIFLVSRKGYLSGPKGCCRVADQLLLPQASAGVRVPTTRVMVPRWGLYWKMAHKGGLWKERALPTGAGSGRVASLVNASVH